jgi:3-oxoacyl-[acyl-carrier-protein] synthase-3
MTFLQSRNEADALELVRKCVSRELPSGVPVPGDEEDFVQTGVIDSMGWVGILSAIEETTGIRNFGNPWPDELPQSVRSLAKIVCGSISQTAREKVGENIALPPGSTVEVELVGWGCALGSVRVEAASINRECGLTPGTIEERAGIQSVCRADSNEDEATLGQKASELALQVASLEPEEVDLVIATSATFLGFPSLSAVLHTRLLLRESCGTLDVGGACVGLLHGLATARSLLSSTRQGVALVVASEVHSRRLCSPRVPGEFRGLFGDGACAFVLRCSNGGTLQGPARLGDLVWGCSGTFASSLRVAMREDNELEVHFQGQALAGAALSQLTRILDDLERRSGKLRNDVDYFAVHEPNPRIVGLFAERANIPMEKIPLVSRTFGNLGSATCGVSLCAALSKVEGGPTASARPLIFVAAVGPGLIWGGTYLH